MNTRHPRKTPAAEGFTLIELLTVIAIIGILASIIIPTVGKVRQSARTATCASNLRQVGAAMQLYANDNKGYLIVTNGTLLRSIWRWRWFGNEWTAANEDTHRSPLSVYLGANDWTAMNKLTVCPENQSEAPVDLATGSDGFRGFGRPFVVNYLAIPNTPGDKPVAVSSFRRPSQTVMMMDAVNDTSWGPGFHATAGWNRIAEPHGGMSNVLWVDGHVTRLRKASVTSDADNKIKP